MSTTIEGVLGESVCVSGVSVQPGGPRLSIEDRVSTTLMVQRYVRALSKFEEANRDFDEACLAIRGKLKGSGKFFTRVDYCAYLVEVDNEGNFTVEQVTEV